MTTLGFTGTSKGMTPLQNKTVTLILEAIEGTEFHHGDCIGSDEEAHYIAMRFGYEVHVHPPENPKKQAFCKGHVHYLPKPYLRRNKDIVNATEVLIATPETFEETLRSGTWSTVRYARKRNRKIYIVNPDGTVV